MVKELHPVTFHKTGGGSATKDFRPSVVTDDETTEDKPKRRKRATPPAAPALPKE